MHSGAQHRERIEHGAASGWLAVSISHRSACNAAWRGNLGHDGLPAGSFGCIRAAARRSCATTANKRRIAESDDDGRRFSEAAHGDERPRGPCVQEAHPPAEGVYLSVKQHHPLRIGQQRVARFQRGVQCLLSLRCRALPRPQKRQSLIQQSRRLLQGVGANSARRKLDRQRHTIKLAADIRNDRSVRVAKVQPGPACHSPLDEDLDRRKRLHTCSPSTRSASRLVASMYTCGASAKMRAISGAAASTRCSQVSKTRRIRLSRKWAITLGVASSDRTDRPNIDATAVPVRSGAISVSRSMKSTAPSNVVSRSCAPATATVVLPTPRSRRR